MATVRRLTTDLIKEAIASVKSDDKTSAARKQIWLSDNDGGRGVGRLMLRVTPSGSHFYFRYTAGGTKKIVAIGRYSERLCEGCCTLTEARSKFAAYSRLYQAPATHDVRQHVRAEFRATRAAETQVSVSSDDGGSSESTPPAGSLVALCNAYASDLKARGRISWKEVAAMFNRHVAPTQYANRPANAIKKEDIRAILRPLKKHPPTQKHLRASLHAAYELAVHADDDLQAEDSFAEFGVELNPVSATKAVRVPNEKRRKRVLSRLELGHLWNHLLPNDVDAPVGLSVRFMRLDLLLGGQRGEQLVSVTVDRVDLERDTILIYDMKGRDDARDHLLPLIPPAKAEVKWLIDYGLERDSRYLFPGKKPDTRLLVGAPQLFLKRLSARMKVSVQPSHLESAIGS